MVDVRLLEQFVNDYSVHVRGFYFYRVPHRKKDHPVVILKILT